MLQSGQFADALAFAAALAGREPPFPGAEFWAGVALSRSGRAVDGIRRLGVARDLFPGDPWVYLEMAEALLSTGDVQAAQDALCKALSISPRFPDALNKMGIAAQRLGDLPCAIRWFESALQIDGSDCCALVNLAAAFIDAERAEDAEACLLRLVELVPGQAGIHYLLGFAQTSLNRHDDAILSFAKAVEIDPDHAQAWAELGKLYRVKQNFSQAMEALTQSIRVLPSYDALCEMGYLLSESGFRPGASRAFQRAAGLRLDGTRATWGRCLNQLPIVYDSEKEVAESRRRYGASLKRLSDTLRLDSPDRIRDAYEGLGHSLPFYLAYQGENDVDLQKIHGAMLHRVMAAHLPEFSRTLERRHRRRGDKIRVGIVSGMFRLHTVWKLFINGWLSHIDRRRFSVHCYYFSSPRDFVTEYSAKFADSFVQEAGSLQKLARRIRDDDMDVLVYPEVGMEPMAAQAAALRLAPVQCASWGHPNTTGLPTLDWFLSSRLMEPEGALLHYSEKLVLLPNISVWYDPVRLERSPFDRGHFGLSEGDVVYLCTQSLFKYLPRYDHLLPRIACEVPRARFVFLSDARTTSEARFRERMTREFHSHGVDPDTHVKFFPQMSQGAYIALQQLGDIYLDSPGWSGGNTSLEALECGLPVVTWPGPMMRGRHTYAILTLCGAHEGVAADLDCYVGLAVRAGLDTDFRRGLSSAVAEGKRLVYLDLAPIRALEDFLEAAVDGKTVPGTATL